MSRYFVRPADCPCHDLSPGVAIHTMAGRQMMMSVVDFEPNAVVERHSHPHEQTGFLVSGRIRLVIGDETFDANPGDSCWCIPGNVGHGAVIVDDSVAIEVFSPLRKDFLPEEQS